MVTIPVCGPQGLDEAQQEYWNYFSLGPRSASYEKPLLSLPGPHNAWLKIPTFGILAAEIADRLRGGSLLPVGLRELTILTTARHWDAQFVFWAHARMARAGGLDEAVIEAVRVGRPLPDACAQERTIHAAVQSLMTTGQLPDTASAAVAKILGEAGLVEFVSLAGFYVMVAMVTKTFEVALPDDVKPLW